MDEGVEEFSSVVPVASLPPYTSKIVVEYVESNDKFTVTASGITVLSVARKFRIAPRAFLIVNRLNYPSLEVDTVLPVQTTFKLVQLVDKTCNYSVAELLNESKYLIRVIADSGNVYYCKEDETISQAAHTLGINARSLLILNLQHYKSLSLHSKLFSRTVLKIPFWYAADAPPTFQFMENRIMNFQESSKNLDSMLEVVSSGEYTSWQPSLRVKLLKLLCDLVSETQTIKNFMSQKEESSEESYLSRAAHLGKDHYGNRYWCFSSSDPKRAGLSSQPLYLESAVDGRWGRVARLGDIMQFAQSLSLRRGRDEANLRSALFNQFGQFAKVDVVQPLLKDLFENDPVFKAKSLMRGTGEKMKVHGKQEACAAARVLATLLHFEVGLHHVNGLYGEWSKRRIRWRETLVDAKNVMLGGTRTRCQRNKAEPKCIQVQEKGENSRSETTQMMSDQPQDVQVDRQELSSSRRRIGRSQFNLFQLFDVKKAIKEMRLKEEEKASRGIISDIIENKEKSTTYCICGATEDNQELSWIACDGCDKWFHTVCVGLGDVEASTVTEWLCFDCSKNDSRKYCICQKSTQDSQDDFFIGCEGDCNGWFHPKCVGLDEEKCRSGEIDLENWICPNCDPPKDPESKVAKAVEAARKEALSRETKILCPSEETEEWIQCYRCDYWTLLPQHVDVKLLPNNWCCEMASWEVEARCMGKGGGTRKDMTIVEGDKIEKPVQTRRKRRKKQNDVQKDEKLLASLMEKESLLEKSVMEMIRIPTNDCILTEGAPHLLILEDSLWREAWNHGEYHANWQNVRRFWRQNVSLARTSAQLNVQLEILLQACTGMLLNNKVPTMSESRVMRTLVAGEEGNAHRVNGGKRMRKKVYTRKTVSNPVSIVIPRDCRDERVFNDQLLRAYPRLETKWPRVNNKNLKMYILYREVQRLGGIDVVQENRMFQRITPLLGFDHNATSSGFQLSKNFDKYLRQFEELGIVADPRVPDNECRGSVTFISDGGVGGGSNYIVTKSSPSFQAEFDSFRKEGVDIELNCNEWGGSSKYSLYGAEEEAIQVKRNPTDNEHSQYDDVPTDRTKKSLKTQSSKKKPRKPKPYTGFIVFSNEHRSRVQKENPDLAGGDIAKKLGEEWRQFTQKEKDAYHKKGITDFKQRLKDDPKFKKQYDKAVAYEKKVRNGFFSEDESSTEESSSTEEEKPNVSSEHIYRAKNDDTPDDIAKLLQCDLKEMLKMNKIVHSHYFTKRCKLEEGTLVELPPIADQSKASQKLYKKYAIRLDDLLIDSGIVTKSNRSNSSQKLKMVLNREEEESDEEDSDDEKSDNDSDDERESPRLVLKLKSKSNTKFRSIGHFSNCCVCMDGGELIECEYNGCGAVYHLSCVGLTEDTIPEGKWICPRHTDCNQTRKRSSRRNSANSSCSDFKFLCSFCPAGSNSLLKKQNGYFSCPSCFKSGDLPRRFRYTMSAILSKDWSAAFRGPVDRRDYPDYYELIEQPIDLSKISAKVGNNEYESIEQFFDDIKLMKENCETYCRGRFPSLIEDAKKVENVAKVLVRDVEKSMTYAAKVNNKMRKKMN
eukprot:g3914.t1